MTGLARPVFESYAHFPKLGLSGVRSQLRVSKGVATAGVSAKASNHSPSGCSGITSGARAVTPCLVSAQLSQLLVNQYEIS